MNLIEALIAVPDHRHPRGIRHELWLILTIILLVVARDIGGISRWLSSPKIIERPS